MAKNSASSMAWLARSKVWPASFRAWTAVLLVTTLCTGCLSASYEIPRTELEKLVQVPPADRGAHIRAVQRFSTAEDLDPAPAWPPVERNAPAPDGYVYGPRGYFVPSIYLGWGYPHYSPYYYGPTAATSEGALPRSGGGGSSGSKSSKDGGPLLVAAILAGVVVGTALVFSEGMRYDGWVAVHPHHPVHLLGEDGSQHTVPLDELTPAQISGQRAVVVGPEGAGMWLRRRASLDRQGFTFQFGLGGDHLALPDQPSGPHDGVDGLGWRFALGYFPTRWTGILLDTRLARHSEADGSSWHAYRAGIEGQWMPLQFWRVHLGGFGGAGQNWAASSPGEFGALPTTDTTRTYVDFGGILEIDLTTRLGLTFRWIEDWLPNAPATVQRMANSWSLGLAIY